MAAARRKNRMASELLQIIRESRYNPTIAVLHDDDKVTLKQYKEHRLAANFRLDTRHLKTNRRVNHNSMYELFAKWSLDEADELKALIIDKLKTEHAYYSGISMLWMKLKGTTFDRWLEHIKSPHVSADEFMLFVMCREFDRHCAIFTMNKSWSTIQSNTPVVESQLIDRCDLFLLYMGRNQFGILQKKTSSLVPLPKDSSPYDIPHINRRSKGRLLDLSIKNYEQSVLSSLHNDSETVDLTVDKTENQPKKKTDVSPKNEPDQYVLNVTPESLRQNTATPTYVQSITDLPSFDDDDNDSELLNTTPEISVETPEDGTLNVCTEPTSEADPMFDDLFFPEITPDPTCTSSINLEKNQKRANKVQSETTPATLQDLVKSFMLGENFIHNITLEDIERICRCKLVLLRVVSTGNDQIKEQPKITVKPCSVLLKRVKEVDLMKLGLICDADIAVSNDDSTKNVCSEDQQDPLLPGNDDAIEANTDSDELPDLVDPHGTSRYPKRNIETVSYKDNNEESDLLTSNKKRRPLLSLKEPSNTRLSAADRQKRVEPKIKPKSSIKGRNKSEENQDPNDTDKSAPISATPATSTPSNSDSTIIPTKNHNKKAKNKGEFNAKFHGLEKFKKPRTFTCLICGVLKSSLAKMNKHHRLRHQPVTCTVCNRTCSTPSSLARHMYLHGKLDFVCDHSGCTKSFAFASELKKHKIVHRTVATFKCHHKG